MGHEEWQRKGVTLSDKTAREEFGLTQDEITEAIRAGKLRYRLSSAHGNLMAAAPSAGGRGSCRDQVRRPGPEGTAGKGRTGTRPPRSEAAPG
jgi:hypothetical protein